MHTHPMGEARSKALSRRQQEGQAPQASPAQMVDTLGGRMHVRWDEAASATPHDQLVYFAELLATTGVFERWVDACPLSYRSGNSPIRPPRWRSDLKQTASAETGAIHTLAVAST